jgi:hypothetical protein
MPDIRAYFSAPKSRPGYQLSEGCLLLSALSRGNYLSAKHLENGIYSPTGLLFNLISSSPLNVSILTTTAVKFYQE